ncbi:MAG: ABC transporter permease [Spirochaetia bacterium]|jgi:spermidine/putrescine transport system permease protein|nr:ABC transporter permease [Spirochaetia bacterium]
MKLQESHGRKKNLGGAYAYPMGAWLLIFFLAPMAVIICYSFLQKALYGGVEPIFSLQAYARLFDKAYGLIALRTFLLSVLITVIVMILAIPTAYAIVKSRHQTLLLALVLIPFLTNSLLRIFAWMSLLGSDGIIVYLLSLLGVPSDHLSLLYNSFAVVLVSVYMFLPYAILPVFASIDRFDFALLEAARDLGASRATATRKVLFPSIKGGIETSVVFTFISAFGNYTVPLLVGGKDSYLLGNLIADQVTKTRNWPLAAAFSLLIALISTVGVLYLLKDDGKEGKR